MNVYEHSYTSPTSKDKHLKLELETFSVVLSDKKKRNYIDPFEHDLKRIKITLYVLYSIYTVKITYEYKCIIQIRILRFFFFFRRIQNRIEN